MALSGFGKRTKLTHLPPPSRARVRVPQSLRFERGIRARARGTANFGNFRGRAGL